MVTKAPATLPPPGLSGLEQQWSRLVAVSGLDADERTFHVLDSWAGLDTTEEPEVTLLCVHGNPSWSYLWRHVIAHAPPTVRVIAVDQLDMGFSERTGTVRRLAQRVEDLNQLTETLGLTGPVMTLAHDWGGPVSLGWVMHHRSQTMGVVLTNTAVHQPAGSPAPSIIRLARRPAIRQKVCVDTPGFIKGALRMSRPRPPKAVRDGFMAPYLTAERRAAISTFVEDIPLEPDHPTASTLDEIADSLNHLQSTPVLLAWGPSDPVFSDLYLRDFQQRLPHADTHRFVGASHFLHEELDVAGPIHAWIQTTLHPPEARDDLGSDAQGHTERTVLWGALEARAHGDDSHDPAVIEITDDGQRSVSFSELHDDVGFVSAGLRLHGIQPGDRVALMIPPGVDLSVCLYACWRAGIVAVLVDSALGPQGMSQAVQGAAPKYIIGITKALAAARTLGWPGERIAVEATSPATAKLLGIATTLEELRLAGTMSDQAVDAPGNEDDAVVVFTSGSTGPSKGVVYKHKQLQAQRDALVASTGVSGADRLVAAFAPFALFGPAMGLASVVPNMDVTAPATLTAASLAEAVRAIDATVVFASPAALRNVISTGNDLDADDHRALSEIRLLLSAGAPVHEELLQLARSLMPNAEASTPYGMTELLPAAVITLSELEALRRSGAHEHNAGVCVGPSAPGVLARIAPFDDPTLLTKEPGVTGEVLLRAAHAKDRYDKLWATQYLTEQPSGWHRSGDVGHIDASGNLWIEGRMVHVIETASGPVTPVGIELAAESLSSVSQAACVGVGPADAEQVVVVVVPATSIRRATLADTALLDEIRAIASVDIASVLVVPKLPTDRRHNSKIDRTAIAEWAAGILAGGRITRLS